MKHTKSVAHPTVGYVVTRGAGVAFLAVFVYTLAFTMFATVNEGAGLFGTLIAIWIALSIPALTIALLLLPLAVLLGVVTVLLIWGISAACNREYAPNKAVSIGSGTCILIAMLLIVSLNQGLGLSWAPTVAEALTFWLVLPLLVYIVAGGLASWELNRRPNGEATPISTL
jgi:hypothetical protein